MSTIDRNKLIALYARLKGMERMLAVHGGQSIDGYHADDIGNIVREVGAVLGENVDAFMPHRSAVWRGGNDNTFTSSDKLSGRLQQLLGYLEATQHVGTEVVEIGTLFNAIKDEELRGRCADLLSASTNFDRAINQATQVLEDRIRKRVSGSSADTGPTLVRKAIPHIPVKGTLKISDNASEQEGWSHTIAGLMMALRNPTHHTVTDTYTREDALKVCAFVDNLIRVIDKAVLIG